MRSTSPRSPRSATHSPGRPTTTANAPKARPKEALRALKRRISDVVYRHLVADAAAARSGDGAREGNQETTLTSQRGRPRPEQPALRNSHSRTHTTLRPHTKARPEPRFSAPRPIANWPLDEQRGIARRGVSSCNSAMKQPERDPCLTVGQQEPAEAVTMSEIDAANRRPSASHEADAGLVDEH